MALTTKAIVLAYAAAYGKNYPNEAYDGSFSEWYAAVAEKELLILDDLPSDVKSFLPLREEVYKLVIKELYGIMPFSKEYIVSRYQREYGGKKYLVYPAENPGRLVILFSGYINYVSYNRFSWYYDSNEQWCGDTVYLFLNDPSLHWYVGHEDKNESVIYREIIELVASEFGLGLQSVYAVGASMGGYAALLFSYMVGLGGCVAVHPQLCKQSAARYELDNWSRKISECGYRFLNIEDVIAMSKNNPIVYLEVGRHPSDACGLEGVVVELSKRNSSFILERTKAHEHNTQSPSREKIDQLICFFESSVKWRSVL